MIYLLHSIIYFLGLVCLFSFTCKLAEFFIQLYISFKNRKVN